jgi:hypothetical protein
MPAKSPRQKRFFLAVKGAKHNPDAPEHLRKVADSMSDKDIDDFIKCESEFKTKKAILSVLKDIVEPMYLNEGDEGQQDIDAVSNTFHVKSDWATYIKLYVGQPFSSKELEALDNFKEKKPTTIARTEIWYNTTDSFNISHTTVIKKMKDSGQFSFTAFQKQERPTPDEEKSADDQLPDAGTDTGGTTDEPQGQLPPGSPTPPSETPEKQEEKEKDDIIVTKSVLFKDDIKGAAILIEFLKKLDL